MGDELKRGEPDIGHSSTTAPGGEKDLTGGHDKTPGKDEEAEDASEGERTRNEGRGEPAK